MLTVLDLFSGIGGFSLGLERTGGFRTVAFCEIDPFCRQVLAKHWPDVPIHNDIRELDGIPADIVCGGFPCQPWSVAGQRRGTDDDRDLWPEMLRIVSQIRPRWVVGENVPGLAHQEMGLDRVLSDLDAIGYWTRVFGIPACAVDAPHRRERLWIVGHAEQPRTDTDTERCRPRHTACKPSSVAVAHGARYMQPEPETGGTDGERVGTGGDEDVAHDTCQQMGTARQPWRCEHVGNAAGDRRREGRTEPEFRSGRTAIAEPSVLDNAMRRRHESSEEQICTGWDGAELAGGRRVKPGVRLLAHGIPQRVAKLRALGNAVVPQVVEAIGNAILEAEAIR